MSSCIITVEIEVEVFYTLTEDGLEAVNAICQQPVNREVSSWAENQAIIQFEKHPSKAVLHGP